MVHVRKKKLKLTELELQAYAGVNKDNKDKIVEVLDSYRRQLFPGMTSKTDDSLEEAKKHLASAVQEVFIMKPLGEGEEKALRKAATSGNADIARWANQELRKRDIERKGQQPIRGSARPLPPGVNPQKR